MWNVAIGVVLAEMKMHSFEYINHRAGKFISRQQSHFLVKLQQNWKQPLHAKENRIQKAVWTDTITIKAKLRLLLTIMPL